MIESKNYGLAGGTLAWDPRESELRAIALALSDECGWEVRWYVVHAQLYIDAGLDKAEYHANWGV